MLLRSLYLAGLCLIDALGLEEIYQIYRVLVMDARDDDY